MRKTTTPIAFARTATIALLALAAGSRAIGHDNSNGNKPDIERVVADL